MMKNRFFLKTTLYIVFILFSLQIAFNYFFDSYGFFRKNDTLDYAAQAIIDGHTIAGTGNYDERIFQKKVFEKFPLKPECILIGSSRSMMVEAHMVNHHGKFFNHSVSGASLEDYIAIIGLYTKNDTLPQKIILGIDPWIFNQNNTQKRWQRLSESYSYMLTHINPNHPHAPLQKNNNEYFQLINFENTKYNLLNLKQTLKNENTLKIINDENFDALIKRPDGSILYPFKTRYQKDTVTLTEAKSYIRVPVYSVENFDILSNQQLFEQLIHYLNKKNVEVIFFLPPYHPLAYEYLSNNQKYKNILHAENYLREYAQKNNFTLIGSYNPNLYHFNSSNFTDGMHAKTSVVERIFKDKP